MGSKGPQDLGFPARDQMIEVVLPRFRPRLDRDREWRRAKRIINVRDPGACWRIGMRGDAWPDIRLFGGYLGDLGDLKPGPDLLDSGQHLDPEFARHRIVPAMPVHEALHHLFEAILPQAGTAFVEVLADLGAPRLAEFPVQIRVDPVQDLATRHFVRLAAAHGASSP